ncbi:MAG TPA: hypothetical protein VHS97_00535 [Isosphaeraceae bacterium]|nr:hypothetical protein [Isosphaeraceae bacterium]
MAGKTNPTPILAYGDAQITALALAGTVALPSPFPASARISMVISPEPSEDGTSTEQRFSLKLVEVIGDKLVVTRFVRVEHVRAIRFRSGRNTNDDPWTWQLKTSRELYADFRTTEDELKAYSQTFKSAGTKFSFEQNLESGTRGIVYVPETAPVLVRTEVAVVAAQAVDIASSYWAAYGKSCWCSGAEPPIKSDV